jgi:hypothetical protein
MERGETHNISTRKKRLVVATVLALVLSPILELNGGIRARRNALEAVNGIALVAWVDIRDVIDNLVVEIRLRGWVSFAVSESCFFWGYADSLFATARRKATCHASSAILNATEP